MPSSFSRSAPFSDENETMEVKLERYDQLHICTIIIHEQTNSQQNKINK